MKTRKFDLNVFAKLLNVKKEDFPQKAIKAIDDFDFSYKVANNIEIDSSVIKTISTLLDSKLKVSGPNRKQDWERGWSENLKNYEQGKYSLGKLIPKFVKDENIYRFRGKYIKTNSRHFETNFVQVIRYCLFSKYFKDLNNVYEFGTGTGLNLIAVNELFPDMELWGLDWAISSTKIINVINKKKGTSINSKVFDLFKPSGKFKLKAESAVFTIGTLEQLGENFKPFIKYLIKNKPKICINIETLYELYDEDNLVDFLAIKYLEKRNYLRGYIPYLRELEKKKLIKILSINRTFGSFYHEGYSYVIWRPI